jgi:hypothetical protein
LAYYQSTHSISITAPAEKIYGALTDWPLRAQWRKGVEIVWQKEGKAFVGQEVSFKVKRPLFSYPFSFRVTGLEAPRRMYMEYLGKPLTGRAAIEITPEEKGCRVDFHWMKVEPAGWAAKLYFALGLGMRTHRRGTMETLRMLKNHLEN